MPIGRSGPHGATGIGFLAQQKYYNIFSVDSGPFIFRPIQRSLPEAWWVPPANAFQPWTYSYNLNLIGKDRFPTGEQFWERPTLPIPPSALTWTGTFPPMMPVPTNVIFRPYWRGLPEQPPIPLSQQSTFGVPLQLRVVVQAPFSQDDWPLPTQPSRIDQAWTWSYNINLIGQDRLPVGEQRIELAPAQVPPDQIQLHSWQWWYNLNLLGKDRMLAGKQVWELAPSQRPPEQIQLHSWTWSYNLNLRGQDQLPTGVQRYDLSPIYPPYINQLRTWTWEYNLNLIGQDRFPTGEQVWERPTLPIPPAQTWLESPQYELIAKPFLQSDWPNPSQPYRLEQTWVRGYTLSLIGQDQLPFRQLDWPLPLVAGQPALFWVDPSKIWLTAPVRNLTIDQYWDRPILPIPPARSWEWSYNLNLIGQDRLPVGEQVSELSPRDFSRLFQTWINSVNAALVVTPPVLDILKPQRDWPVPRGAEPDWRRSWEFSYNRNLIGQDQLPFRQTDWPVTRAIDRAGEWIQQTALVLTALQRPFAQFNWPNPIPPARDPTLATIAASYNRNLVGQDRLPFAQNDWPNPSGHTLPTLLQTWYYSRAILYPPPVFPPGKGFFDRPQLRTDQPADQFFAWARYPIIPVGPPAVGASYRLLRPHYIFNRELEVGQIVTEGVEIPFGWVPTLAVDPLNASAVAAFYAAGPRGNSEENLWLYSSGFARNVNTPRYGSVVLQPITYWRETTPGSKIYQLTGLGTGNAPIGDG